MNNIREVFAASIKVKSNMLDGEELYELAAIGDEIVESIMCDNKLMFCGNGGSAADAQHLVAEMLVRLRPHNNREGIPAITLAQDTSTMTACGNDFEFELLYERMVMSLGKNGDCLIGISTSGNSENILRAMRVAKSMDIKVFGFLGSGGGEAFGLCDKAFVVPSNNTGRIQESHITAGHALVEYVEDRLLELGYLHLKG